MDVIIFNIDYLWLQISFIFGIVLIQIYLLSYYYCVEKPQQEEAQKKQNDDDFKIAEENNAK